MTSRPTARGDHLPPGGGSRPGSSLHRRAAALLVLALLLAACGGGTDPRAAPDAAGSGSLAPSVFATGNASAFPVRIEHMFGTTTIPAAPQQVVTVGFNDQDFALALGVTPVGTREYLAYHYESRPWAQHLLPDEPLPTVGGQELDFEAVAALEPDLILGVYSFIDQNITTPCLRSRPRCPRPPSSRLAACRGRTSCG